jgi:hypothetical protein
MSTCSLQPSLPVPLVTTFPIPPAGYISAYPKAHCMRFISTFRYCTSGSKHAGDMEDVDDYDVEDGLAYRDVDHPLLDMREQCSSLAGKRLQNLASCSSDQHQAPCMHNLYTFPLPHLLPGHQVQAYAAERNKNGIIQPQRSN